MMRMPTDYAIVMYRKALEQDVNLLDGLPMTLEDLEKQEFIPLEHYAAVIERFYDLHPEPEWGFRLGELFTMATHGPTGFGAMAASTIRNGLAFMGRYIQTRTCYTDCRLEYHNLDLHLVFQLDPAANPLLQRHCETLSSIFQSYIVSAGASAGTTCWRFPYAAPAHAEIYKSWLHGGFSFDADELRLEVPHSVGEVPSAFRNDAAFKSTTSQCEAILMEATSDPLLEKVHGILASRIERRVMESVPVTDIPSADEVADHLQVSRRTLIRQLKEAGTSFQSIKDELRRQHLNDLLLNDDLRFAEIADRLGYAEAANFTRACKRLFGQPPAEIRANLRRRREDAALPAG